MPDQRARRLPSLLALSGMVVWVLGTGHGPASDRALAPELDSPALTATRAAEARAGSEAGAVAMPLPSGGAPTTSEPVPEAASTRRRYVVVLDDAVTDPGGVGRRTGGELGHVYSSALKGFSVSLTPRAAEALARDRRVRSVELDRVAEIDAQTTPTGLDRVAEPDLRRAQIPNLAIDGMDDVRVGAAIAVIDTGIASHPDLNVVSRVDCLSSRGSAPSCRAGGTDGNGHGTHVAGTAAAIDNGVGVVGVAPGAPLYSVKVLDSRGEGSFSDVIAGIDWVTARADRIEVANMSLGGSGRLRALDTAIRNSVNAGVTHVVAAGNGGDDAGATIPANHPDVIAVSALADSDGVSGGRGSSYCGRDDALASFSNHGRVVDVVAPGACIRSTLPGGYGTMSGTSMATPHVAGAAALLAANGHSVASIRSTIPGTGNGGWTDTSGDGVKEPLLDVSSASYRVAGGSTAPTTSTSTTSTSTTTTSATTTSTSTTTTSVPPAGNAPPTATFTTTCAGRYCILDAGGSSDRDGAIRAYGWAFGDGSSGSGSLVMHLFGTGTFTVVLTVTDDLGATATAERTVRCTPACR